MPAIFRSAALDAVMTWKFKPATLDGQPVKVYYTLTVNSTMETGPEIVPLFAKFMEENPDFGALMRGKRYLPAYRDERQPGFTNCVGP